MYNLVDFCIMYRVEESTYNNWFVATSSYVETLIFKISKQATIVETVKFPINIHCPSLLFLPFLIIIFFSRIEKSVVIFRDLSSNPSRSVKVQSYIAWRPRVFVSDCRFMRFDWLSKWSIRPTWIPCFEFVLNLLLFFFLFPPLSYFL